MVASRLSPRVCVSCKRRGSDPQPTRAHELTTRGPRALSRQRQPSWHRRLSSRKPQLRTPHTRTPHLARGWSKIEHRPPGHPPHHAHSHHTKLILNSYRNYTRRLIRLNHSTEPHQTTQSTTQPTRHHDTNTNTTLPSPTHKPHRLQRNTTVTHQSPCPRAPSRDAVNERQLIQHPIKKLVHELNPIKTLHGTSWTSSGGKRTQEEALSQGIDQLQT